MLFLFQQTTETYFISNVVFPVFVALLTYFIVNKFDEYKRRKNTSILGALIIESLIEEVRHGYNLIHQVLDFNNEKIPSYLPRKSWSGIMTISDDVLLRIIETSKNATPVSFMPREIRIHTKNYFDHMIPNWDAIVSKHDSKELAIGSFSNYEDAALGVLKMLEQTKELLESNAKRLFPK
jgi:hypothetical protein